jgi:hypothetical protein
MVKILLQFYKKMIQFYERNLKFSIKRKVQTQSGLLKTIRMQNNVRPHWGRTINYIFSIDM